MKFPILRSKQALILSAQFHSSIPFINNQIRYRRSSASPLILGASGIWLRYRHWVSAPLPAALIPPLCFAAPNQIAGADTPCRADICPNAGTSTSVVTIVRAVITTVGTSLKRRFPLGVLACQVAGVFDRRQSDCGTAHLVRLNGKVYWEVVVSRYRTDHNDIFRQNIGSAQHIIRKLGMLSYPMIPRAEKGDTAPGSDFAR